MRIGAALALMAVPGCSRRTPAPLYSQPIRKVEVKPVDVGAPQDPEECTEDYTVGPGDRVPCVGVLLPIAGPNSAAELVGLRAQATAAQDALNQCYLDYEFDRAVADDAYGQCTTGLDASEKQAGAWKGIAAGAGVAGFIGGALTTVGVAWALDGALAR